MKTLKKTSTRYKLRAEAPCDIGRLLSTVHITQLTYKLTYEFGDCVATFDSPLTLDELRDKIAEIEDGHVMLETVELESRYDGERIPVRLKRS